MKKLINILLLIFFLLGSCVSYPDDIRDIVKMARSGDPEYQFELGQIYYEPKFYTVEKNNEIAYKWFSRSANKGYAEAQYMMGKMIIDKEIENRELIDGIILLEKAAKQDHIDANFILGDLYLGNSKYETAIYYLERCSELQYRKVKHYLNESDETTKNLFIALNTDWDGKPDVLLGKIFFEGIGVEKNYYKAFKYLSRSEKIGNSNKESLYLLAECYLYGLGTIVNEEKAFDYFNMLTRYYSQSPYYYKAALVLANLLYFDYNKYPHVVENLIKSKNEFNISISSYTKSKNIKEFNRLELAYNYYTQAAKNNNSYAQVMVGQMLRLGQGTLRDFKSSFDWYQKAANQGEVNAQFQLGRYYYFGIGTSKNLNSAKKWIRKAYENGFEEAENFWNEYELWMI